VPHGIIDLILHFDRCIFPFRNDRFTRSPTDKSLTSSSVILAEKYNPVKLSAIRNAELFAENSPALTCTSVIILSDVL
ncbi:MAG: hypothetical protein K2O42_00420, partial [Oscillospiraceae bacterium]|nr:hypothetical protein [Oscillospiraceae bacterium]